MGDENPNIISAGKSVVGTLVARGIIKPEEAERAIKIIEEELGAWLAIKHWNERN